MADIVIPGHDAELLKMKRHDMNYIRVRGFKGPLEPYDPSNPVSDMDCPYAGTWHAWTYKELGAGASTGALTPHVDVTAASRRHCSATGSPGISQPPPSAL
jgi:bifunctional DNA-binding transcriptional regulator/antitoxin component of YhaV-PrlF toxin-antitoxin module